MDTATEIKPLLYILGAACLILLFWNIYLTLSFSALKRRYDVMMVGDQTGKDFEAMLFSHIAKTDQVSAENIEIRKEQKRLSDLLDIAVTRIGVVRFAAFSDMGSDLSFSVALLNQKNDGIVISSIFGREESRTYAKPIKDGASTYKLTKEELTAIKDAKNWQ